MIKRFILFTLIIIMSNKINGFNDDKVDLCDNFTCTNCVRVNCGKCYNGTIILENLIFSSINCNKINDGFDFIVHSFMDCDSPGFVINYKENVIIVSNISYQNKDIRCIKLI